MWLRFGIVVLASAYIWGTPFVRQVLRVHQPYARQWVMFGGYARDTCVVDLKQRLDGEVVPLDRFELLGFDRPRHAPQWARFATRADPGRTLARRVCAQLGEGADISLEVRCLEGDAGWVQVGDPAVDACDVHVPAARRAK